MDIKRLAVLLGYLILVLFIYLLIYVNLCLRRPSLTELWISLCRFTTLCFPFYIVSSCCDTFYLFFILVHHQMRIAHAKWLKDRSVLCTAHCT